MRNELQRAERRWQKKSLFHGEQPYYWLFFLGWLLFIVVVLLVVVLFMRPALLKQIVQWIAQ